MRVCLVSPPSVVGLWELRTTAAADRRVAEDAGLGLLTLAAILEKAGVGCELRHLSRHLFQMGPQDPGADLALLAAERIAARNFDVLGVSTICSSYPFMLRFAEEVKRRRPGCSVVLGGPQATVTDVATLTAFDSVDAIVRGEADESFPRLLECLSGRSRLDLIPGITYRDGSRVVRNRDAPPVLDLDALPLPAYHLLPGVRGAHSLRLEAGRGCPFSCTFCSTNDYFRRRFRLKSDRVILAQMTELASRFHVKQFELTHDMFTVDRRRVISFCRELLESGRKFHWTCSARTDGVDEELLDWMQQAGCIAMFFGVESGSGRIQKLIGKKLDVERARKVVQWCGQRSIQATTSTIIGFPEEEEEDVRATLQFLFDAAGQRHVVPQISFLAPLAGTPIHAKYRERLKFDGSISDLSNQGFPQHSTDLRLIATHPDLFPNFYAAPTRMPGRLLQEIGLFLAWAFLRCRWLAVSLAREIGDPWMLCERWIAFRKPPKRWPEVSTYYSSPQFHRDFVHFAAAIAGRLETQVLATVQSHIAELDPLIIVRSGPRDPIGWDGIPVIPQSVALFPVPADPEAVIDALVSGHPLSDNARVPVTVVWRRGPSGGNLLRLPILTARLLSLCNGKRKAFVIASRMAAESGAPEARADPVSGWLAVLEQLRKRGLIERRAAGPSGSTFRASGSRGIRKASRHRNTRLP